MKKIILLILAILPLLSLAQKKDKLNIKMGGFIASETSYDTRQSVSSRDGSVYLYPKAKVLDSNGKDINGSSALTFSAIFSRLNVKMTGFQALGAQGTAFVEGDFAGTATDKSGLFRLRHAFVKLDWKQDQLLMGKYWHPMLVVSCYPLVLHWGAALPFSVLSRVPQIRYTRKFDKGYFLITASSELDFKSTGPDGSSSKYMQNASIPEFNTQIKYDLGNRLTVGATAGMKFLKPRLVNALGNVTDEIHSSFHTNLWIKVKADKFVWNIQSIYGENMNNFVMLGGYAVKNIDKNGDYEYTNIKTGSIWSEIYTTTGNLRYALFAAYTKNMGANDDLFTITDDKGNTKNAGLYSRGSNIDYAYQIGPRVTYHQQRVVFGAQLLVTGTAYGEIQKNAEVKNTDTVIGNKLLLTCVYSF